ncbi:hypothetical protein AB0M05_41530 [Streptomyces violaceusniger]|uniref:hypothetical protein n=1 Tax=Streptomyces violaceusniger TaxID=68280 RepID=UPI00342603C9
MDHVEAPAPPDRARLATAAADPALDHQQRLLPLLYSPGRLNDHAAVPGRRIADAAGQQNARRALDEVEPGIRATRKVGPVCDVRLD